MFRAHTHQQITTTDVSLNLSLKVSSHILPPKRIQRHILSVLTWRRRRASSFSLGLGLRGARMIHRTIDPTVGSLSNILTAQCRRRRRRTSPFPFRWVIYFTLNDPMLFFKFHPFLSVGYVRICPVILGQYSGIGHGLPSSTRMANVPMTIELDRSCRLGHVLLCKM